MPRNKIIEGEGRGGGKGAGVAKRGGGGGGGRSGMLGKYQYVILKW